MHSSQTLKPLSEKRHSNSDRIERQKPFRVNDCAANAVASFLTHAAFVVLCARRLSDVIGKVMSQAPLSLCMCRGQQPNHVEIKLILLLFFLNIVLCSKRVLVYGSSGSETH